MTDLLKVFAKTRTPGVEDVNFVDSSATDAVKEHGIAKCFLEIGAFELLWSCEYDIAFSSCREPKILITEALGI
jgi:hypothetical protein